jgi:hypothetical protein
VLSRVKYAVEMAKSHLLHEMKEYLYSTLQKLAVGKILRISRSDRSATHGQTAKKVTAKNLKNFNCWRCWQSDRPGTEVGGQTGP